MITQPLAAIDVPLFAPILVAVITGFFTWFVQAWRFRREAGHQATQVLRQYRDPLLRAAYDLQSRIYNIVAMEYLDRYWRRGSAEEKANAIYGTLWFFGQYLGWTEILRREIQYLDIGSRLANQRVQGCLNEISAALATDAAGLQGGTLQIIRSDQRAVGDFMVTSRSSADGGKRPDCLGYSEFIRELPRPDQDSGDRGDALYSPVSAWGAGFTGDLERAARTDPWDPPPRLIALQRLLIDLVDQLDPDRSRFPHLDFRGKLPRLDAAGEPNADQVAQFVWPWAAPWPEVEKWARRRHLSLARSDEDRRTYHGRRGPTWRRPEFTIVFRNQRVIVRACNRRGDRRTLVNGSLRGSRTRLAVNDLLRRFDRPSISGGTTVPGRIGAYLLAATRRMRGPTSGAPGA